MASLLADMASKRGIKLPTLSGETEQALLDMDDLLTFGKLHNPADIRGYGADVLPQIAETVFADDSYDMYVFAIGLSAVGERAESIADDIITVREMADQPVLFLWTGRKEPEPENQSPLPYERVRKETPLYYDPSKCMDAVASLARFAAQGPTVRSPTGTKGRGSNQEIDDLSSSVPVDSTLTWSEASALLSAGGIEVVDTYLATGAKEAQSYATAVDSKVAMKVDSRAIPHRTDAGAVAIDVKPNAVEQRYSEIIENTQEYNSNAEIEGVLIQQQIDPTYSTEVLVGVSSDESFGPVVTVAPGGEFVELFGEETAVTLIPPVQEETVRETIESSKLGDLLRGYRGRPSGDLDALATLVTRIGRVVTSKNGPYIEELDLNPVFVNPEGEGVSIVDILIRTGSEQANQ